MEKRIQGGPFRLPCWEARKILLFKKSAAGIYFDGERLLINKHVHRSMLSHKKEDLTTASRG